MVSYISWPQMAHHIITKHIRLLSQLLLLCEHRVSDVIWEKHYDEMESTRVCIVSSLTHGETTVDVPPLIIPTLYIIISWMLGDGIAYPNEFT
jgi:hypothetical protein